MITTRRQYNLRVHAMPSLTTLAKVANFARFTRFGDFASCIALTAPLFAASAAMGQSCTGLCLQQMSCPAGGTTAVTGTVYAPNGTDPLPGVIVYIPNGTVAAFTPGVSCAVAGQPPSGNPLVGTTTAVDGTFTLSNVPAGSNIPLVIQSGRWRRQVTIPSVAACTNTAFNTRFPQKQTEGDIPRIAVVTGSADAVECVLRKVGVADTEFTDASGSGRVNLFRASGGPGSSIDPQTPVADNLLANQSSLDNYDVLMLPCEGGPYEKSLGQLSNLISYANAGGRVYASHFSYEWFVGNGAFNTVVNWDPGQPAPEPNNGVATIDTGFAQGQTLTQWLGDVGASTAPGQVAITTVRHDLSAVNPPTQTWLTLNNAAYGNPIMQFTFDTPVGATANACGRVLFNEYHVEDSNSNTAGLTFPAECSNGPMTSQEKLLEFNLFDLTGNGTAPTLTPASADFGAEPVGSTNASQKFLWTNNTFFPVVVGSVTGSGDFHITGNTCATVAVGASCAIDVDFAPTALGVRTGTLTATANTGTLASSLTGNGTSPLVVSGAGLGFGLVDVGASVSQTLTLTNTTAAALPIASPAASGDFNATTTCSASLPARSSCSVTVIFTPSATGPRTGTLNFALANLAGAVASTNLSGTGIDFTETVGPVSAQTIAGLGISTTGLTTPIAGFANPVTVTCTTTAPASQCTPSLTSFTPSSPTTDAVTITTTSRYAVVGYGSLGEGAGGLCVVLASGLWLLRKRRRLSGGALSLTLLVVGTAAVGLSLSGCSGKQPGMNTPYTPAGTYSYTVTATDGFLKHSATYTLVVTQK